MFNSLPTSTYLGFRVYWFYRSHRSWGIWEVDGESSDFGLAVESSSDMVMQAFTKISQQNEELHYPLSSDHTMPHTKP